MSSFSHTSLLEDDGVAVVEVAETDIQYDMPLTNSSFCNRYRSLQQRELNALVYNMGQLMTIHLLQLSAFSTTSIAASGRREFEN